GSAEPRVRGNDLWITAFDTGQRQCFSREIQASEIGILIDIPQDIGQLKCAAEMVSQGFPVAVIHTENANAQPPHRAGYTVAIKIKFAERWSADIRACVHLHAIDDRQEIVLAKTEPKNRPCQIFKTRRNASRIERINVLPPYGKELEA